MHGQFEDLVHEKGKEVQKEEVEGKVLLPVAVSVLDVVALILGGIENLVFYFPSTSAYLHESFDVIPVHGVGDLLIFHDPVFNMVDRDGLLIVVEGDIMRPLMDGGTVSRSAALPKNDLSHVGVHDGRLDDLERILSSPP